MTSVIGLAAPRRLRMTTREAGKQEAAIADLKGRPGASRANLFKRKRRAQRQNEYR